WKTKVSNAGGSGHQLRPATDCTVFAETSAASNASAVSGVGASGMAAALPAATSSTSASSPARNAFTLRPSPAVPAALTSSLPAEERIARDTPRRALEIDLALEEVEEERRVVESPALAPTVGERIREELARLADAGEVLLVGRLLVGVRR